MTTADQHARHETAPAPPVPDTGGGSRDRWVLAATGVAMGCLLISIVAVGLAARYADERDGGVTAGAPVTFDIMLGDIYVEPASIAVESGSPVTLTVTNAGAMPHDLKLDGTDGTAMLEPGETEEITIGPFEADAQAWCTVPGHREAGMIMDIRVIGAAPIAAAAHGVEAGAAATTGAAIDFNAEPAEGWQAFDPTLQPAPGGTEHLIELSAEETVLEVAPGVTQQLWTFGGQFPGPVMRGRVGDIFTVTLTNNGEIGHSIDFHASKVAWNDEMRTIQPGESLVYQFEAKHAGVWMYHCGTAPALHHIGNGMFGALIIDPPDLPPVDHEYVLVQSELYTGPIGEPGDLAKMQSDAWDAVVFNGYVNQYKHQPIRVEPGERVRAFVLDAGPSENSSFHIVGTIFDTVFKEGTYLLRPDGRRGGAQALDLQPAQGGFVEFTFDEAGLYPIVTHKFSNVGKGALGLFQAGDVDPSVAGGH
jgi:nitrite reductase (NO-forming)